MKALSAPLPLPPSTSARYWTSSTPANGPHLFRHPYYGVGASLFLWMSRRHIDDEAELPLQARYLHLLPAVGAVLGVCWFSRTHALDTPPLKDVTDEVLEAYGRAVAEELQEHGYDLMEMVELFNLVSTEFVNRQSLVVMAQERVAFTAAPTDGSTSNC